MIISECKQGLLLLLTTGCIFYPQGLKFISFPYLLTLQLKRFAFDYATLHRVKLNDRSVVLNGSRVVIC